MAVSRSDMAILAADQGFIDRVRASLVSTCIGISREGWTTPFHRERQAYVVAVMNDPETYAPHFAHMAATDNAIINGATANGTIPLTAANVAAQALLANDADIDAAVSGNFEAFFRTPGM